MAVVASLAVSCASDDRPGATATPPSTTIAATTVTAAAGQVVRGTGYRFTLPAGWQDATARAKKSHGVKAPALVLAGTWTQGVRSNLDVDTYPSRGSALAELVAEGRSELNRVLQDGRPLGELERFRVAGTPAMAHEFTFSKNGYPLRGRQVACLRGGSLYSVTLIAHRQAFTTERAALDQVLASWSWG